MSASRKEIGSIKKHGHDFFEIEMILSGSGTVTLNDSTYPIQKNSIYLLTPVHVHANHAERLELFNVMFESVDASLPLWNLQDPLLLTLTDEEFDFFYQLMNEIVATHESAPTYARQLLGCILQKMQLCAKLPEQSEQPYINEAILFLLENFRTDITLEDVSAHLGLSRNYLGALFFHRTGIHFKEYLNSLRFSYACSLLSFSDLPISEVCTRSGFSDYANFSRRFKQKYGVSPRVFRRNKQE